MKQRHVKASIKRKIKLRCPFHAATGLLGATKPGQRVTVKNAHHLPAGSVVRLDEGGRLIHLHDAVWLHCSDYFWRYDALKRLKDVLPGELCHMPAPLNY